MVDFVKTYCSICGKKDIYVKRSKDGSKIYKQNPDFSFHTTPITVDGSTKWICVESKDHVEWAKEHNARGVDTKEFVLKTPHYTEDELKHIDPPKQLDSNMVGQTKLQTPSITKEELGKKFEPEGVGSDDQQLIKDIENLLRASIVAANNTSTDLKDVDKDTRISTQGFAQAILLAAVNLKLASKINELIKKLDQKE